MQERHTSGSTGGKWVSFAYCVSFLVVTFRRHSAPVFVRDGQSRFIAGLPYTLLTLVAGWWGFPFGLIFTPWCIIENLAGGKVVGESLPSVETGAERTATHCPSCYSTNVTLAMGRSRCGTCGQVF